MGENSKYIWLSFIVISILFVERVTVTEVDYDEPSSLYGPNDHITVLNSDNFNRKIYNKNQAFFVEFFSSWCGACIGYAETYKQLARQLLQWEPIVQIAAVDCANSQNLRLCREHNVDAFPTIKYFKYKSTAPSDAVTYKGNKYNLNEVALDIAELVYNDWMYRRPLEWPNFSTSDNYARIEDLLPTIPPVTSLLALIVEDNPSRTAWAEMIAFANDKRVYVTQIQRNNPIAQQFGITAAVGNSRLFLLRKGQPTPLYISMEHDTWLQMQNKINEHLAMIPMNEILRHMKTPDDIPEVVVTWSQFEVQMMDIITALRYMLTAEIPRKSVIKDEKLAALKSWVHAMKKYMPGTIPMRKLLYRLDNWLKNVSTELTSEEWIHKVKTVQDQLGQPLPSTTNYMACRGSKVHFRGFSCGVWTIIHSMSVQAYKIEKDNPNFNANDDLIEPFHQFIWNFFGCSECATHFHEGISRRNMTEVVTPGDGIMWFWMTHNIVNKYIANKASEDPAFPKQQFPPASLCPQCRRDGEFDTKAVLDFMINYYGDLKIDGLRSVPGYKVSDFEDGRLVAVETKHLNPKFQIGAFYVDSIEKADLKHMEEFVNKPEWESVENGADGSRYYGGSSVKRSFSVLWLSVIAVVVLFIYMKYRRNRFKIWKTFCYNDYKL
uniref:Sulfhydryl oxidase n=1 Tax=Elaeophora elaphi TaxID=1147741 RepID=A0A158Q8B1_9BILA